MLTEIFCLIDDLIEPVEHNLERHGEVRFRARRGPQPTLCASEVLTIGVMFHFSHYRNLKHFYNDYVLVEWRSAFPKLPPYRCFNKLYSRLYGYAFLIAIMLTIYRRGHGIFVIDPTPLPVCNIKRESSHEVMLALARKSKSTMGWYYGLKLHLVVNLEGELVGFFPTPANCDERNRDVVHLLTKGLSGYLIGDKGYIDQKLTHELLDSQLRLITPARKNMKTNFLPDDERNLLRARQVVESCIHTLKDILHIQHTRHRSGLSYFMNLFTGLIAYDFYPRKPKSRFKVEKTPLHEILQIAA